MEFRQLTREEYDRKLREVIVGAEGHHGNVRDVGDGRATIGWGHTLNRDDNRAVWRQAGLELAPERFRRMHRSSLEEDGEEACKDDCEVGPGKQPEKRLPVKGCSAPAAGPL